MKNNTWLFVLAAGGIGYFVGVQRQNARINALHEQLVQVEQGESDITRAIDLAKNIKETWF